MTQSTKTTLSSLLDESQYSKKSTDIVTSPDDNTGYTSPQGVLFDPNKHEIDKQTGKPGIRSDGEFKKRRGWQGAIAAYKQEVANNKDDDNKDNGGKETDYYNEQSEEFKEQDSSQFDIPDENNDFFEDPETIKQNTDAKDAELEEYIQQQAKLFIQVSEGILVYAIGEEWRLEPEEVTLLQGPASRCMKKYGIFELAPELELIMVAIIIGKNRLNPATHPRTSSIWQTIKQRSKAKMFDWWARTRWGRRKQETAERMTDKEVDESKEAKDVIKEDSE